MSTHSASESVRPLAPLLRREEILARRSEVADGAVAIIPRTTCLVVRADPSTHVGEQVRRSIQEVREDGARVVFRNGAYRLRESQAVTVAGALRQSADAGVRAAGRVMVGQPEKSVRVTCADPQILDQALPIVEIESATPSVFDQPNA